MGKVSMRRPDEVGANGGFRKETNSARGSKNWNGEKLTGSSDGSRGVRDAYEGSGCMLSRDPQNLRIDEYFNSLEKKFGNSAQSATPDGAVKKELHAIQPVEITAVNPSKSLDPIIEAYRAKLKTIRVAFNGIPFPNADQRNEAIKLAQGFIQEIETSQEQGYSDFKSRLYLDAKSLLLKIKNPIKNPEQLDRSLVKEVTTDLTNINHPLREASMTWLLKDPVHISTDELKISVNRFLTFAKTVSAVIMPLTQVTAKAKVMAILKETSLLGDIQKINSRLEQLKALNVVDQNTLNEMRISIAELLYPRFRIESVKQILFGTPDAEKTLASLKKVWDEIR